MNNAYKNVILSLFVFSVFLISCKPKSDKFELIERVNQK